MTFKTDYGWRGRLGLGTPQANPNVEAEMRRLVPKDVEYLTVRMTSASDDSAERLCDYLQRLPEYITRYAKLKLDGFMFACTASNYLMSDEQLAACRAKAEQSVGAPLVMAADAVETWMRARDAQRIALLSPYPEWLHDRALSFWRRRGFDIADTARIEIGTADTYAIYAQHSSRAAGALRSLDTSQADIILIGGTGMASLPLIRELHAQGREVVSSNLALASAGLALLGKTVTAGETWWHGADGAH